MIFGTVGFHYQGFERLIKKLDEIAGNIDENIIIQVGHAKYLPKNAEYFDFCNNERMLELINSARIVICHGGEGSIITALGNGKPVIAVPRLRKFGEHINDHQLEIVNAMNEKGKITAIYNIDELEKALNLVDVCSRGIKKDDTLINFLKNYLKSV